MPGEGRTRLPGVQRDQRYDNAQHSDQGSAEAGSAEDARHARDGRVRGAFVEPQDPRSARLQGGAQLAKTRERLNPALRQALRLPRVLARHHTLAPQEIRSFQSLRLTLT